MNWLIKKLVDSGWVRLGLAFRWIFGTKFVLKALINDADLNVIEKRYKSMEKSGFFSGKNGAFRQQSFIQALFFSGPRQENAFSKALSLSSEKNSPTPFASLLHFIHRFFFQGPHAQNNKQTFIDAVLTSHNGKSNALSRAASTISSDLKAEFNPLPMVLNSITEAGCFTGPQAAKNKQNLVVGILNSNKDGENALVRALKNSFYNSKVQARPSNAEMLWHALTKAGCFKGSYAEANKEVLMNSLATGRYYRLLEQAMWNPNDLQLILTTLTEEGCFASEKNKQIFLDALIKPDFMGKNCFSFAANVPKSLDLIYKHLKAIGCFTKDEDKQKLINAIFSPDDSGNTPFKNAFGFPNCSDTMLALLSELNCFDTPSNQQAFVKAVFAKNKYGNNCLSYSSKNNIFKTLTKINYLTGPFKETNIALFLNATLDGNEHYEKESTLLSNCNTPLFPILLEQLTIAGCFTGPPLSPSKKAFIDSVFATNKKGKNLFSSIYTKEHISLLLKKLEEADCFTDEKYKAQFIQGVRADGNAFLFHTVGCDVRAYTALHKSLVLAGCSTEDIKKLLNEPHEDKYNYWTVPSTPLMRALRYKSSVLAARLILDGAEITPKQQQQLDHEITSSKEKCKKMIAEAKAVPFNIETIKKELLNHPIPLEYRKLDPKRRSSLSDLSVFTNKQTTASTPIYAADDSCLYSSSKPR